MSLFDLFKRKKSSPSENENESEFRVEDRGSEKVLKYGNITYSRLKEGALYTREYWDYFIPAAYVFQNPKVLLIGLGGGTVVFQLTSLLQDSLDLDAIELSKRAVELSQNFIPKTRVNIMLGDGAAYVATTNRRYDAIILDAYTSSKIPAQFLGRQFIASAHSALSSEGILAINYAMTLMGMFAFHEYVAKLKEKFRVYEVKTALTEGNVIILCSKSLGKEGMVARINQNMEKNQENSFLFRNYSRMKEL